MKTKQLVAGVFTVIAGLWTGAIIMHLNNFNTQTEYNIAGFFTGGIIMAIGFGLIYKSYEKD